MAKRCKSIPNVLEIYSNHGSLSLNIDESYITLKEAAGRSDVKYHFEECSIYSRAYKSQVVRVTSKHIANYCKYASCKKQTVWKKQNHGFEVLRVQNGIDIVCKSDTIHKIQIEKTVDIKMEFGIRSPDHNISIEFNCNNESQRRICTLTAYGTVSNISISSCHLLNLCMEKLTVRNILKLIQPQRKPGYFMCLRKPLLKKKQSFVCDPQDCLFDHKNKLVDDFFEPVFTNIEILREKCTLFNDDQFTPKKIEKRPIYNPKRYTLKTPPITISLDDYNNGKEKESLVTTNSNQKQEDHDVSLDEEDCVVDDNDDMLIHNNILLPCCVCMSKLPDTVLLCGHVLCNECAFAYKTKKCPHQGCKEIISSFQKLYLRLTTTTAHTHISK